MTSTIRDLLTSVPSTVGGPPSPGRTRRLVRIAAAVASAGLWLWPVTGPHPVVQPFQAPPTPYSAGHRGIDIGAPEGAQVIAPADGIVHFAGVVVDRPLVSLDLGDGVLVSFEPVQPALPIGAVVHRGDLVGTLQPGHCDAPCLHLGVRVDGEYVSPLRWLGGVPRSVLLPLDSG